MSDVECRTEKAAERVKKKARSGEFRRPDTRPAGADQVSCPGRSIIGCSDLALPGWKIARG